ncbi:hypothetical protein Leryth_006789 [Lithospermum erythrorhizon]|nr:hypothetical protein Leryth_006789 [Lithospermum erythrorhizon]
MAINKTHIRSISLQSRSHPSILQIEQQLNKIRTCESSATPNAETISNGLCGLVELYISMDDFLNLPQSLQAFAKYQNAKWVDEILDCPVQLLDVCGITKDILSQFKGNVRDLQSSLRRRKGDLSIEACITNYTSLRNKMAKVAKRCISTLKKMDHAMEATILDMDQEVSSIIRVVREVNALTISIFQSVLAFLSKTRSSKWSFAKLIVNKSRVSCEGQQVNLNELEVVDNALSKNSSTMQQDLEQLEASIEGIEKGLESMTRCLIRSRTLLLNVKENSSFCDKPKKTKMANFSKKSIRSISLPCRSHPTTIKIEEELNKLKNSEVASTTESICDNICGLVELYKCINELLNMPQTIQALSKHQSEKWVDELLEGPLKLLDICAITRDVVSQFKENVRDLQSSLRRRKGDLSNGISVTKYTAFRKKMKKDVKKLISTLKQMDYVIGGSILDVDQHVSALIRVLREVYSMSVSIFQFVLSFLSASKKQSKWSISRLVSKGEDRQQNELENVDNMLCNICGAEEVQYVQNRLEHLEVQLQGIEARLENIFKCLIKSRTFLLNIFSC